MSLSKPKNKAKLIIAMVLLHKEELQNVPFETQKDKFQEGENILDMKALCHKNEENFAGLYEELCVIENKLSSWYQIPGATISVNGAYYSSLIYAIVTANIEAIRIIIGFSNPMQQYMPWAETALHIAVRTGRIDILDYVLNGFSPRHRKELVNAKNLAGNTGCHLAFLTNPNDIKKAYSLVKIMLKAQANITSQNNDGFTCIELAKEIDSTSNIPSILEEYVFNNKNKADNTKNDRKAKSAYFSRSVSNLFQRSRSSKSLSKNCHNENENENENCHGICYEPSTETTEQHLHVELDAYIYDGSSSIASEDLVCDNIGVKKAEAIQI